MHLKPIRFNVPWRVVEIVMFPVTCLYVVIFALPLAILWLVQRHESAISPEWHPVFAWWPTRCDDWANDGFVGTVWLETIERRNKFPHGIEFRRAPTSSEEEA